MSYEKSRTPEQLSKIQGLSIGAILDIARTSVTLPSRYTRWKKDDMDNILDRTLFELGHRDVCKRSFLDDVLSKLWLAKLSLRYPSKKQTIFEFRSLTTGGDLPIDERLPIVVSFCNPIDGNTDPAILTGCVVRHHVTIPQSVRVSIEARLLALIRNLPASVSTTYVDMYAAVMVHAYELAMADRRATKQVYETRQLVLAEFLKPVDQRNDSLMITNAQCNTTVPGRKVEVLNEDLSELPLGERFDLTTFDPRSLELIMPKFYGWYLSGKIGKPLNLEKLSVATLLAMPRMGASTANMLVGALAIHHNAVTKRADATPAVQLDCRRTEPVADKPPKRNSILESKAEYIKELRSISHELAALFIVVTTAGESDELFNKVVRGFLINSNTGVSIMEDLEPHPNWDAMFYTAVGYYIHETFIGAEERLCRYVRDHFNNALIEPKDCPLV